VTTDGLFSEGAAAVGMSTAKPVATRATAANRRSVRTQEVIVLFHQAEGASHILTGVFDTCRRNSYEIVTGVPSGISRSRRLIAELGIRTQPCETRPGRISGRFVP
jgi:hypothetical protein